MTGGKVGPRIDTEGGLESEFIKYGEIYLDNEDPREFLWTVTVPWEQLKTMEQVTITDQLSGNHDFLKETDVSAFQKDSLDRETWNYLDVADTSYEGDQKMTVTVNRPTTGWVDGKDLTLNYYTKFNGEGYPQHGEKFTNSATHNGEGGNSAVSATVVYDLSLIHI